MKGPATGVGGFAAGQVDLKKSLAFDGEIERIAGGVEITLQLDDLGSGGTSAKANLEARRDRSLLGRSCSGHHHVLVQQILELQTAAAESGGAGIGQVVGDSVQIELLRLHAAGGG